MQNILEFQQLTKTEEIEFDKLTALIEELWKQLDPSSATWGLSILERELGLPVNPDLDTDTRRSLIKSKLLMQPPGSKNKLEEILKSFVETAETEEIFNEYRFNIILKTLDTIGHKIPHIYRVVEEFKPAHLDYMFIICYLFFPEVFIEFKKYLSEKLKIAGLEDINENECIETLGRSYTEYTKYLFNKWLSLKILTVAEGKVIENQGRSYKAHNKYLFNKWPSENIPVLSEERTIEAQGRNYKQGFKYQINSYISSPIKVCSQNTYVEEEVI